MQRLCWPGKGCSSWAQQVCSEHLEGTVLMFTLATLFIPPTPVSTANWLQMDSYIHKHIYQCCLPVEAGSCSTIVPLPKRASLKITP